MKDLDAGERRAILDACGRLRAAVTEASRKLGIEPVERAVRREIRGKGSILWASLEDTKSEALRGYGSLSPEAAALVDGMLDRITSAVLEILRLVG